MPLTDFGLGIPVVHHESFPVFNIQAMSLPLYPPTWWNVGAIVLAVLLVVWLLTLVYSAYGKKVILSAVFVTGMLGFALLGGFWFAPPHGNVTCEMKSEKLNVLGVNNGGKVLFRNSGERSVKVQILLSAIEAVNPYVPEGPVWEVLVGESSYDPPRGRLAKILMPVPGEEGTVYNLGNCKVVMEGL